YPRGPHAADARRRLAFLSVALEPPPAFDAVTYDVPPPPPEEIVYVERPVLVFDDPIYAFAPPPHRQPFSCRRLRRNLLCWHRRRPHSESSCCRSRYTLQCRCGFARPFTSRHHLRITLYSKIFTTQL